MIGSQGNGLRDFYAEKGFQSLSGTRHEVVGEDGILLGFFDDALFNGGTALLGHERRQRVALLVRFQIIAGDCRRRRVGIGRRKALLPDFQGGEDGLAGKKPAGVQRDAIGAVGKQIGADVGRERVVVILGGDRFAEEYSVISQPLESHLPFLGCHSQV